MSLSFLKPYFKFVRTESARFQKDKAVMQMNIFRVIHIAAILATAIAFISEYFFYINIISTTSLNQFTWLYVFYTLFLVFLFIQYNQMLQVYEKKETISITKSNVLLYLSVYIPTTLVFVVTFISRTFGEDLVLLGAPLCIFMVVIMLTNFQRLIYFFYTLALYISLASLTYGNEPVFSSSIIKAGLVNILFYLSGAITYTWYKNMKEQTYSLEKTTISQRKTLEYLVNELQTNDFEIESANLESINHAIFKLLNEFSNSKSQVESALAKAKEASDAKESFLASMSHEIRTPLNTITGLTRELLKDKLNPRQTKYTKRVHQASRYLNSIVNNILDLSKIEANELTIDQIDFSLESMIGNVTSMLTSRAEDKGIQLNSEVAADLNQAYIGDPLRIKQVLINIISNAIKFTNDGSVSITTSLKKRNQDVDWVKFTIKDTGIGMETIFLHSIFKKFAQENNEIVQKYGGSGLGMTISKQLVDLMDGKISIDSKKGVGTSVQVVIPLKRGNFDKILPEIGIQKENTLAGKHILLAEDNKMNQLIVKNSLRDTGCSLHIAKNGRLCIEKFQKHPIDIILMDIQMPELNGIEATKHIRNELQSDVPIIALTANAFKQDIDLYLAVGMNDYVTKPYKEITFFNKLFKQLNIDYSNLKQDNSTMNSEPPNELLYDLNALEELSPNDPEFLSEMLQLIEENVQETIRIIQENVDHGSALEIRNTVHKIKPSLKTLNVYKIEDQIATINAYQEGDDSLELFNQSKQILPILKQLLDELQKNKV